jgi:Card1-like, endonuclease domain
VKETAREFQRYGVRVEHHAIPYGLEIGEARAKVRDIVRAMDGHATTLNLSGHNTTLSLAAYDVFRDRQWPVFTIGNHDDQLIWLSPEGVQGFDLQDRVTIETFLRLNGFEVETSATSLVPPERRELAKCLVHNLDRYGRELHGFNWLASEAKGSLISPPVAPSTTARDSYQGILALFAETGLLKEAGNRLEFTSEDARDFICGGWLEDHVFSEIRGLSGKGGVHDICRGVSFFTTVKGQRVQNELDVVFLADNRLYFIECKTVKLNKTSEGFRIQNNFLYKLHSLKSSVGELNTRAMLVSYKPMGRRQLERAEAMGLELCSGKALENIKGHIQKWLTEHR